MRLAIVGTVLLGLLGAASAGASTCTVTAASVLVKDGNFERPLPEMVGYAIPVTVVEHAGTFAMDLTAMPVGTFSISGVANSIDVTNAGMVTGGIDASGNVWLPAVQVDFTTALLPGVVLTAQEPVTTGLAAVTLSGNDYATEGSPLDFTTGAMRIEGQGIVHNAPVVGESTSGISIACTLAPIPASADLPKGPSVVAHGTAKPGVSTDPNAVVGDTLSLKAKVKNGGVALDPTQDVFVRLAFGGADLVLLRIPAGSLMGGKRLAATDTDGKTLRVLTGRKQVGATRADVAGSIAVAKSKKGLGITLKESGLDLAALASGVATATIGVGEVAASDSVTVKAGAKKTVLK